MEIDGAMTLLTLRRRPDRPERLALYDETGALRLSFGRDEMAAEIVAEQGARLAALGYEVLVEPAAEGAEITPARLRHSTPRHSAPAGSAAAPRRR